LPGLVHKTKAGIAFLYGGSDLIDARRDMGFHSLGGQVDVPIHYRFNNFPMLILSFHALRFHIYPTEESNSGIYVTQGFLHFRVAAEFHDLFMEVFIQLNQFLTASTSLFRACPVQKIRQLVNFHFCRLFTGEPNGSDFQNGAQLIDFKHFPRLKIPAKKPAILPENQEAFRSQPVQGLAKGCPTGTQTAGQTNFINSFAGLELELDGHFLDR
jgi:hypothetical protein